MQDKDFKFYWNELPEEIIVDNKHYHIWISPYDVSYMAFTTGKQYDLLFSESMDITINDKYNRLIECLERVKTRITNKYLID